MGSATKASMGEPLRGQSVRMARRRVTVTYDRFGNIIHMKPNVPSISKESPRQRKKSLMTPTTEQIRKTRRTYSEIGSASAIFLTRCPRAHFSVFGER